MHRRWGFLAASSLFKSQPNPLPPVCTWRMWAHLLRVCIVVTMCHAYLHTSILHACSCVGVGFSEIICMCMRHPRVAVTIKCGADPFHRRGAAGLWEDCLVVHPTVCNTSRLTPLAVHMDHLWSPMLTFPREQRVPESCKPTSHVTCFIQSRYG